MLQGFFVARNTYRRRGAALDGQQQRILRDKASHLAVESLETFRKAVNNKTRKKLVQRMLHRLPEIARTGQCPAFATMKKIDQTLSRGGNTVAGRMEHRLLHFLLKIKQRKRRIGR